MRDKYQTATTINQPQVWQRTTEKADRQNTLRTWALDPAVQNAAYGAMFCLGVGAIISGIMIINQGYLFGIMFVMFGAAMLGYGLWGSATLTFRLHSYEPMVLVDEERETNGDEEPKTPLKSLVRWHLLSGEYIEFSEPEPNEFVRFVTLALDDKSGVTLSQNTAVKRGWTKDMHGAMMADLFDRGIAYQQRGLAPDFTTKGKTELNAYLRMQCPHPSESK